MKTLRIIFCWISFALCASGVGAQQSPPDGDPGSQKAMKQAHTQLVAYLAATDTLTATFRSVLLDEERAALAESSGRMAIKRPGRFRWQYELPSPSLIVADGESLWSFDPELEQAVVRRIDQLDSANPTQLLGGDADLDRDFEVIGAYQVDRTEWIEVRPRAAASDFERVRLGFVDGAISMMELGDKLGQITQIVLTDVVVNEPLKDSLFTFEPPPGTAVVGGQ